MRLLLGCLVVFVGACGAPVVKDGPKLVDPGVVDPGLGQAAQLRVVVTGFPSIQGVARLALFSSADGFPADHEKALATQVLPVKSDSLEADFEHLRAGQGICVAVIHDANDDQKLDTNLLGIPTEAFGVSMNPSSSFGPPSCEQARFLLKPGHQQIRIELKRY